MESPTDRTVAREQSNSSRRTGITRQSIHTYNTKFKIATLEIRRFDDSNSLAPSHFLI